MIVLEKFMDFSRSHPLVETLFSAARDDCVLQRSMPLARFDGPGWFGEATICFLLSCPHQATLALVILDTIRSLQI